MSSRQLTVAERAATIVERFLRPLRPVIPMNAVLFITVFFLSLASFWLAYEVRFEFSVPPLYRTQFFQLVLAVGFGKLILFYLLNGHKMSWRYVGIKEIPIFIWHGVAGSLFIILLSLIEPSWWVPRGIIVIDLALTMLFVGGSRLILRMAREMTRPVIRGTSQNQQKSAIVIGAGESGETVLREIMKSPQSRIMAVALFDDSMGKLGIRIHGVPVAGNIEDIPLFVKKNPIDLALVAIPSATSAQFNRIYNILKPLGIPVKTLPSFHEMIHGVSTLRQFRDINVTDLVGREEIRINKEQVISFVAHKTVLVTGAGGSIGSELCRQLLRHKTGNLVLLERSENGLFHLHRQLSTQTDVGMIHPVLCDITEEMRTLEIFDRYKPDIVFHAAAHKHVPIQELDPAECFINNVGGTVSVSRAADQVGVKHFVMISSDKAVNPTSVMGATKRVCEVYCQALGASSHTVFVSVRFGNVLGSEGSVVPIFLEQISRGGPITITHPDMKRYFMTIPEAVALVIQAAAIGESGQVMFLDMGIPVKIVDLVNRLLEISGKTGDDIPVEFVGMRPGEKLFEELLFTDEAFSNTAHEKVKVCKSVLNGSANGRMKTIETCLREIATARNNTDTRRVLKSLVPEYFYDGNTKNN